MRRRLGAAVLSFSLMLLMSRAGVAHARPAALDCDPTDLSMQVYPVPLPTAGEWVLTQTWGGSGNYRTEVFEVAQPEFLLEWQAWQTMSTGVAGIPAVGLLQVEVHRVVGGADTLVTIVNAAIPCQASRLLDLGPGRFYLRIVAPNLNWRLMVEESR